MKNQIIQLIRAMVITVAINILIAGLIQIFHFEFWGLIWAIAIAIITSLIVLIGMFSIPLRPWKVAILVVILSAISFIGNQWLYYSANDTVRLKNVEELLSLSEKPMYFTLDEYKITHDIGHSKEEHKSKKGRHSYTTTSITYYAVAPIYKDSTTEEAKVWIATQYQTQLNKGNANRFTLRPDKVINFELLTTDIGHFKDAVADSPHVRKNPHPIFIAPLYEPYIKKSTWGIYFLMSLTIGTAIMALSGIVLNKKEKSSC